MGYPKKITKDDCTSSSVGRGKRRFGKVYRRSKMNDELLPKDVLVSIFTRVASCSFDDLLKAKLSCGDFLDATNDEYIYKYVSMDKFPISNWRPSDKVVSFLTRCFEKENAEALFRHGMTEYFKHCNFQSGLKFLKRASEKKHLEATCVYGLFLLSRGDESSSKQGLELLSLKSSRPGNWNVRDCRDKVGSILSDMFFNKNMGTFQQVYTKCRDLNHGYEFSKRDRDFAAREDLSSCDTCMWYRELAFFCKDRRLGSLSSHSNIYIRWNLVT